MLPLRRYLEPAYSSEAALGRARLRSAEASRVGYAIVQLKCCAIHQAARKRTARSPFAFSGVPIWNVAIEPCHARGPSAGSAIVEDLELEGINLSDGQSCSREIAKQKDHQIQRKQSEQSHVAVPSTDRALRVLPPNRLPRKIGLTIQFAPGAFRHNQPRRRDDG